MSLRLSDGCPLLYHSSFNATWLGRLPLHIPEAVTQWQPGVTPMSTVHAVFTALCFYVTLVFGGQLFMRDRKSLKLALAFKAHNTIVYLGSAVLLSLILWEIIPMWFRHGTFFVLCHECAFTKPLEFYYIANYYFKYYEFIDSLFLVLKKKPLTFLHVFHHAATALLCYTQLEGRVPIEWTIISLNLLVHVMTYYYYSITIATDSVKIWWKKYLTAIQISQFVIDLSIVHWALFQEYIFRLFGESFRPMGGCAGTETAAWLGWGLLSSYLFLYIRFYRRTYK